MAIFLKQIDSDHEADALLLRVDAHTSTSAFGLPTSEPNVFGAPNVPSDIEYPDVVDLAQALRAWGSKLADFASSVASSSGLSVEVDFQCHELPLEQMQFLLGGVFSMLRNPTRQHLHGDAQEPAVYLRSTISAEAFANALRTEETYTQAVTLAAELTDARANQLTPQDFAARARAIAQASGLGFRITEQDDLERKQYGGITAIGAGSAHPPVLIELWWNGGDAPSATPPEHAIALAGKGVTFDSGGLSLKPPAAMYSMHTDCAGAATVLAAMSALQSSGISQPVYAALPVVENIPGPNSVRPGDVVTMRNGLGLEIIDTDFEGRVVLADAISKLAESHPLAVVSLATLTYQIVVALGPEIAGVFSRDPELGARITTAASAAGEAVWPMPWATRYAAQLRSSAPGADVRNHPLAESGRAITAALFLGEFTRDEIPFAHIDCAGPAVISTADGPSATGFGVRTLLELLSQWR